MVGKLTDHCQIYKMFPNLDLMFRHSTVVVFPTAEKGNIPPNAQRRNPGNFLSDLDPQGKTQFCGQQARRVLLLARVHDLWSSASNHWGQS
jgi:hypothetical protein